MHSADKRTRVFLEAKIPMLLLQLSILKDITTKQVISSNFYLHIKKKLGVEHLLHLFLSHLAIGSSGCDVPDCILRFSFNK